MKRYTTDELQEEYDDWLREHVEKASSGLLYIDASALLVVERFIKWLKSKE